MQIRDIAPAIIVLFTTIAITAQAQFTAPETGKVGIMFAPWMTAADAFRRVAGDDTVAIVGNGKFANIIIAEFSDPSARARIYAAGAWWIFDPQGFGGCFNPRKNGA